MKKHILLLAAVLLTAATLQAQSFQQAFFLDGYRLGYRYNPAIQSAEGFLSVGQFENQSRQNFGAASFLYPRGEEVVTALHPSVSAEEFLGSLQDDSYMNGSINYNLVSYGWRKGAAFHTLEANVRGFYMASVPKEIFTILKLGTEDTFYDLSGFSLGGNAIVELAYGYSRKLGDFISVGARAKLLVGVESLRYQITRFDMVMSEEKYQATVEADLDFTSRWRKIGTNDEGYLNFLNLSAKDRLKTPTGGGLAVDLGILVTPLEGLSLSASVLDLGGMFWYYGNAGQSAGQISFAGMENLTLEDIQQGNILSQFSDELDALTNAIRVKSIEKKTALSALPFNVNLGARYELPFYRALSLGVTGNLVQMKGMPYREVRGALAWNPWEWLGITANAGTGTYGAVWGAAANVAVKRFRLTAGYCDGFGGKVPYTGASLKPNNKMLTVGLTYDL